MKVSIKSFSRAPFLIIPVFIISIIAVGFGRANAAWWEMNSLPVPQDTREINKEKRMMMGQEFEYIYYESRLSAAAVKDFYQKRLTALGWKIDDLMQGLNKIPNFNASSELSEMAGRNQTYRKGEDVIVLGFTPEGARKDKVISYLFAKGKIILDDNDKERKDEEYLSTLIAKPKKDVVCVYPEAVLSDLNESKNFLQATYFAKGDIVAMVDFYKNNMVTRYAWSLADENSVQSTDMQIDPQAISKQCPNCPESLKSLSPDMRSERAELLFSNEQGDTCRISFTKIVAKEEAFNAFGNMVIIMVNYVKKSQ